MSVETANICWGHCWTVHDGLYRHTEEVQPWTAKRRAAPVLSRLKGETTAADAVRRHGLKVAEVEEWRERFLLGAENALRARSKEEDARREEEVNRLKRRNNRSAKAPSRGALFSYVRV